jgi:hypothetical protein
VDLTAPPFDARRAEIASPVDYSATQALGSAMRTAGVELFRYPSARDRNGGVNIGVLSPGAFGAARPRAFETWHCTATRDRVELLKRDYFERSTFAFPRDQFLVNGRIPAPAL